MDTVYPGPDDLELIEDPKAKRLFEQLKIRLRIPCHNDADDLLSRLQSLNYERTMLFKESPNGF